MSNFTKLALLAMLTVVCAHVATSAEPLHHWPFDGALPEGTMAHGAARFVSETDAPGAVGKALALGVQTGDASHLTLPAPPLGPTYTIEAWILPTQLGQWNRLVLRWGGAGKYAYHLALHNGQASLCHGQSDGKYLFAEGGRVKVGQWHHLVGVADAGAKKIRITLDGRRVGETAFDGTMQPATGEGLGIGDSVSIASAGSRFHGYLDGITIWDRALTEAEISTHYAERAPVLAKLAAVGRKAELAKRGSVIKKLLDLGVEEIVFAERNPGRDPSGHYYANFGYSCIDPNYWIHGSDGGRLSVLNIRTGELRALVDDPRGAVRDPQVHYDGKGVLFAYRRGGTHHYNLYEARDGKLRQITDGPWDDVEPTYLPSGGIIFCSTRCKRYIGCWLAQSATLHRCDGDGGNIRMLSSGAFTENTPSVLSDGRILYTRWEYVNRDPVSFHHLWAMNPDGSGATAWFGNMYPGGVFIDAKPIPGTQDVALIHSPGHGRNEHAGRVAVVSSKLGPDNRTAMRNISRQADCRDPYPLSADAFLVARGNQILLMDASGAMELVHVAAQMVHEPCPLVPRPREPEPASRMDPALATGTLVLADVYHGRNMAGVKRGAITKLLVLEDLPKPANFHGGGSQPIGHGVTSTLKRILGTVPVEADGSAHFTVPPMRSIYFAALGADGLVVKQMRSFVTVQPGETASCIGCHESRTEAVRGGSKLQALARPASRIEPIAGIPEVMDFPRDVQPILDRHCVGCHNAKDRKGGVVLAGDRGPVFSLSYYALLLHWQVKDTGGSPGHGSGRQPGNDAPYAAYSAASPLMKKIREGHNKVKLTPQEQQIVQLWIDGGAQYAGTYAAYGTGQIGGCWGNNRPVRVMADAWPSTKPAADAVNRRCGSCHAARQLPRHVTALTAAAHGDMLSWTRPLSRYSRHRIFDLTRPENSLALLSPLSQEAGGYAEGAAKAKQVGENLRQPPKLVVHPVVFADTSDPDYQLILTHIRVAGAKLDAIKRFDMPGFQPNEHYLREMQRYGVLPADLAAKAPIDVYATDQAYWRSLWFRPTKE